MYCCIAVLRGLALAANNDEAGGSGAGVVNLDRCPVFSLVFSCCYDQCPVFSFINCNERPKLDEDVLISLYLSVIYLALPKFIVWLLVTCHFHVFMKIAKKQLK